MPDSKAMTHERMMIVIKCVMETKICPDPVQRNLLLGFPPSLSVQIEGVSGTI